MYVRMWRRGAARVDVGVSQPCKLRPLLRSLILFYLYTDLNLVTGGLAKLLSVRHGRFSCDRDMAILRGDCSRPWGFDLSGQRDKRQNGSVPLVP